jgi:hypothetical protein
MIKTVWENPDPNQCVQKIILEYVKEYSDPQSSIRTINSTSTNQTTANNNLQGVPGPETVIGSFPSQISDPVPIGVKMVPIVL